MSIDIRPVQHYTEPNYPIRSILDKHPELLKLVPRRWRGNPTVIAALTALCLMTLNHRASADKPSDKPPCRVAPIFQHGDGRGAFGCEMVAPPTFLSEAEARQVIVEEAKRMGIFFEPETRTLKGVTPPIFDEYGRLLAADEAEPRQPAPRIKPDGADRRRKVSYIFVSESDLLTWQRDTGSKEPVKYSYNLKQAAQLLGERVCLSQPQEFVGVLYDPVAWAPFPRGLSGQAEWQTARQEHEVKSRQLSLDQLRAQVRDFIKWLKAQGVI